MKRAMLIIMVLLISALVFQTVYAATASSSQGSNKKLTFSIKNPLEAKDLGEFVSKLTSALFQFAIPIAVGLIIWGGIRILVSR
ncbi:MAG: hypothetical protein KW806_03065, partial [Candidatus Yanofskybacteria bacterium]|nr:hypothetical protein [Candidatus Yanofskybacteria bacterium]